MFANICSQFLGSASRFGSWWLVSFGGAINFWKSFFIDFVVSNFWIRCDLWKDGYAKSIQTDGFLQMPAKFRNSFFCLKLIYTFSGANHFQFSSIQFGLFQFQCQCQFQFQFSSQLSSAQFSSVSVQFSFGFSFSLSSVWVSVSPFHVMRQNSNWLCCTRFNSLTSTIWSVKNSNPELRFKIQKQKSKAKTQTQYPKSKS